MRTLLFLLVIFTNTCFADPQINSLFNALNERLAYMPDVAHYKAMNQLPIEDVAREKKVNQATQQAAQKVGLDVTSAIAYNQAQMTIAKVIQYRHRAHLLTSNTQHKPLDLKSHIRPNLIRLGSCINRQLSQWLKTHGAINESNWLDFKRIVNHPYLTEKEQRFLFDALTQVRLKAN